MFYYHHKCIYLTLRCWLADFPVKIAFLVNHIVQGSRPERGNFNSKAFRSLSMDPGDGISTFPPCRRKEKRKNEERGETAAVLAGNCHCCHTVLLEGDGRLPRDYSISQNVSNEGKYNGHVKTRHTR